MRQMTDKISTFALLLDLLPRRLALGISLMVLDATGRLREGSEQPANPLNQKKASQLKAATWYEQVFRILFPG